MLRDINGNVSCGVLCKHEQVGFDPHTLVRHLGIMVNSVEKKFFVPQDRVEELAVIIEQILKEFKGSCTLRVLEKCVGKCRSMAIAVPCAILYTRAQLKP